LESPVLCVSFGTRLPVLDLDAGAMRVRTPDGVRWIPARDVAVGEPGATGEDLVHLAQTFHGLPYLWGGRSGFAPDCSGLTSLVFEAAGVDLPRDASAQAVDPAGVPVAAADLEPGDLLFWAHDSGAGAIHHVAIYAGDQQMVEAPGSTEVVRTTPIRLDAEYWGARRFRSVVN
jgi:cell wall-associated NlpC family hydrolase